MHVNLYDRATNLNNMKGPKMWEILLSLYLRNFEVSYNLDLLQSNTITTIRHGCISHAQV
jgi:hypothetical protein